MKTKLFDSLIKLLTIGKTKVVKDEIYGAKNIWDVGVDNIVISKLIETKIIRGIWLDITMMF